MENEVLGNSEVVVDTPTVDTPTVDTPTVDTPTVDTPTVDTPTVDTPTVDIPEEELNSLLEEIIKTTTENNQEEEKKPEETITNEDLEEIDSMITDLETEISEKDKAISDLSSEINSLKSDFEKTSNDYKLLEDGLNKLSEHPILGPLAVKVIKGEEVNIPDYLTKIVSEDLEAIPNLDGVSTQSIQEKEFRVKDRVLDTLNTTHYR